MKKFGDGLGSSYRWWVLFTVGLANFSATLDMSIVTVSFPRLARVFDTDASVLIWLTIAFAIAELGLMLTLARVGDAIGRKKVYMAGVIIYTVGLVFCSLSPNIGFLIGARIVQGAGAAMLMTVGSAIVVAVFPREQQGRAIGLFSVLVSVGLIAGPALGGVILDFLDWQGMFYTRIPVGIISLLLAAS
jgi:MFS family permease